MLMQTINCYIPLRQLFGLVSTNETSKSTQMSEWKRECSSADESVCTMCVWVWASDRWNVGDSTSRINESNWDFWRYRRRWLDFRWPVQEKPDARISQTLSLLGDLAGSLSLVVSGGYCFFTTKTVKTLTPSSEWNKNRTKLNERDIYLWNYEIVNDGAKFESEINEKMYLLDPLIRCLVGKDNGNPLSLCTFENSIWRCFSFMQKH